MGQSSEAEKSPPSSTIYEKRVVAHGSLSSTAGVQVVGMHTRAHTHTHTHTHTDETCLQQEDRHIYCLLVPRLVN